MWSFSASRSFKKCQRQWYFKTHIANAITKDSFRREAYILSKHQSLPAWRGNIVDSVISTRIVPALNRRQSLHPDSILQHAQILFNEQLEFAQLGRIRESGMTQKRGGRAYAALYPFVYGPEITEEELLQAWEDIEQALHSFLMMDDLIQLLRSASYLVAQRSLNFSYDSISVRAVPDLIAFFSSEPPLIIDWKVHTYAMQNYRLQLASYAIALTQCNPHKDFPESLSQYLPTDIRLLEVQLLTNAQRQYTLSETDMEATYSFIARSAREMALAVSVDADESLVPFDFPVTLDPDECQRCPFRSLCWEQ